MKRFIFALVLLSGAPAAFAGAAGGEGCGWGQALFDGQSGKAVQSDCISQNDGIEPPTAPLSAGSSTELGTFLLDFITGIVKQFRWKRSRTHPGRVGFYNADDFVDLLGADPGAAAGIARHCA